MRGSRLQKLFWIGPISENVSLRVISVVAKFRAFIINFNEFFFWSMPAGLYKCYEQLPQWKVPWMSHQVPVYSMTSCVSSSSISEKWKHPWVLEVLCLYYSIISSNNNHNMVSRIVVGEFEHNLWNWAPTADYCTTNDIESSMKCFRTA